MKFIIKNSSTILIVLVTLVVINYAAEIQKKEEKIELKKKKDENSITSRSSPSSSIESSSESLKSNQNQVKLQPKMDGKLRDFTFNEHFWNTHQPSYHIEPESKNKLSDNKPKEFDDNAVQYLRGCPFFSGFCSKSCIKRGYTSGRCKGFLYLFCHCSSE